MLLKNNKEGKFFIIIFVKFILNKEFNISYVIVCLFKVN